MKTFLITLLSFAILLLMAFGIHTGSDGAVSFVVAYIWVLCLLGIPTAALIVLMAASMTATSDKAKKLKLAGQLAKACKKATFIGRIWRWITFLVMCAMLAYSGWIFTTVVYVISVITMAIATGIGRDAVNDLNLTAEK
uniref:DNZ54_00345 family protein n=1 Tax=Serratia quinivorans TaxID=137545 RepID=UPI0035C787E2